MLQDEVGRRVSRVPIPCDAFCSPGGLIMAEIGVRLYEPRDRASVRQLACETADCGEPVERFFSDREIFADLITSYYTDWEPQSVWIAEHQATVVGYLTGCLETRRYHRIMATRIIPPLLLKGLHRGLLFSPQTWRLFCAGWKTVLRGGGLPCVRMAPYPAHLHLNLQHGFRGQRIGHRLLEHFVSRARAAGCCGIHASVRGDNEAARHFFEQHGFDMVNRHPVVAYDGSGYHRRDTMVYGKVI